MLKHYIIKTRFGWCGVCADRNTVKQVILPGPDKALVLKRLGTTATDYTDKDNTGFIVRLPVKLQPTILGSNSLRSNCQSINLLKRYFDGKRVGFRCKIDLSGFTIFERKVYRVLSRIPYGRTITYSELARRAGVPNGARAVGNVMAKNPLPIIIPCHRVVGKGGGLGGFSAIGGTKMKEQLLRMESAR